MGWAIGDQNYSSIANMTLANSIAQGQAAQRQAQAAAAQQMFTNNLDARKQTDTANYQTGQLQNTANANKNVASGQVFDYLGKIRTAAAAGQYDTAKTLLGQLSEIAQHFDPDTARTVVGHAMSLISGGNAALGGGSHGPDSPIGAPDGVEASAPSSPLMQAAGVPGKGIGLSIPKFGDAGPKTLQDYAATPAPAGAAASPLLSAAGAASSAAGAPAAVQAANGGGNLANAPFAPSANVAAATEGVKATTQQTLQKMAQEHKDATSYQTFLKNVANLPAAEQPDGVQSWDRDNPDAQYKVPGQSYPGSMPAGVQGPPSNYLQPLYSMTLQDAADLHLKGAQSQNYLAEANEHGQQAKNLGATLPTIAPNAAAEQALKMAQADAARQDANTAAKNATTGAQNADTAASAVKLRWNQFSLDQQKFIMNDPESGQYLSRADSADRNIIALNKQKNDIATGYTTDENGNKIPIPPEKRAWLLQATDAAVKEQQEQRAAAQSSLNARLQYRASTTAADPTTGVGGVRLQGPSKGAKVPQAGLGALPGFGEAPPIPRADPSNPGSPVTFKSKTSGRQWNIKPL
jgi:hypothetical protein